MTSYVAPCSIDCAARSTERASMIVLCDFHRGMTSLAAIARMAPLLGAFSSMVTVMWWLTLPSSWCDGGDCAGGIAEAFVPFIISLPVAVFAYAVLFHVIHRVATFDLEIRTTVLETLNGLAHVERRDPGDNLVEQTCQFGFNAEQADAAPILRFQLLL